MNNNGLEIERKFLIAYPPQELLDKCADVSEIEQVYLKRGDSGMSERIRRRSYPDRTLYYHTQKRHITNIKREELEREISREEYTALLAEKDEGRSVITKRRYCLHDAGKIFEIDIFPFWSDRAVMEIELDSEEESFEIPKPVRVIKEVSDDKRYTNSSLAVSIPFDEI